MAMILRLTCYFAVAAVVVLGCAPGGSQGSPPEQPRTAVPSRTLVAMTQIEPVLAASPLASGTSGGRGSQAGVLFSASLNRSDQERDNTAKTVWPELSEQVPRLDTDTWRVFPDGRMETTWILRPGLTWHDGSPLTADDVVFGWQVLSAPAYVSAADHRLIDTVTARDSRTIVIQWSAPFIAADDTTIQGSPVGAPLPRHILAEAFAQQTPEQFASHPYFGALESYVGAGPYKLERWETGAFLEGSAFDNYALGRPEIGRIKVVIVTDKNTALANMLAGEVHMSFDAAISPSRAPCSSKSGPKPVADRSAWNLTRYASSRSSSSETSSIRPSCSTSASAKRWRRLRTASSS
jgi:ABC-type transport system substrate-binding protein